MVKSTAHTLTPQDVLSLGDGYYRLIRLQVNDFGKMILTLVPTTLDEATIEEEDLLTLICPKTTQFDLY